MTVDVIQSNEVLLNSIRYPITGQIAPVLASKFAQKMVTGDYSLDSDPDVSAFGQNDWRGGSLAEEMVEQTQGNRDWFSNCIKDYPGYLPLPRLTTVGTVPSADTAQYISPTGGSGWTNTPYAYDEDTGTSATAVIGAADYSATLELTHTGIASCSKIRIWVGSTTNLGHNVDVYYEGDWHDTTGTITAGQFSDLTLTGTHFVTKARVVVYNGTGGQVTAHVYEFDFYDNAPAYGTPVACENFYDASGNEVLYYAFGVYLTKLNSGGTGFDKVKRFPVAITCLKASLNNKLYVGLGDDNFYWSMTTADAFTENVTAGMNFAEQFDGKLFKLATDGTCYYSTNPDNVSPTWTTSGDIDDLASGSIHNIVVYFDADGNEALYAGTTKGVKALDLTHTLWYDTPISLGNHPNGSKGFKVWRDGLYISAGLNVTLYQAGVPATVVSTIGLDRDDSLPVEYNGEIVGFFGANNTALYALVDSTQATGTSTSTLWKFNGLGWSCVYIGGSTEKAMHTGIVSSDTSYRIWFTHDSLPYYKVIPRGIDQPKKLTTNYESTGFHITPWFDADWAVGQKLALKFSTKVISASATETVTVSYRIDHATTAVAATWTTLGSAITSPGVTTINFPNNTTPVGTAFYAIQFRFDLVSGTATNSPSIEYFVLSYKRIIPARWGWRFTIDCTKPYGGHSPEQLLDLVVTASETATLVPFCYEDSTYYVEVKEVTGNRLTGEGTRGTYNVFVQELI